MRLATIDKLPSGRSRLKDRDDLLLKTPFNEWCRTLNIKTIDGLKHFEPFDWQLEFLNLIIDTPRTPFDLLSSRQTGKTIGLLALIIYFALSRFQFAAVVVHRKGEDVYELARRCKKLIPDDVRLSSESLSLLEFKDTGSQIHFRSCNPVREDGAEGVGRGLPSIDFVLLEESSHTSNTQEVLGVLGPTLTHSSMATVVQVGTSGSRETYYYKSLSGCFGSPEKLEATLGGIRGDRIEPFYVQRTSNRIAVITNWRAIPRFKAEGQDESGYPNYLKRIKKEQRLTDLQVSSEHELVFGTNAVDSWLPWELIVDNVDAIAGDPSLCDLSIKTTTFLGFDIARKRHLSVFWVVEKVGDVLWTRHVVALRGATFSQQESKFNELMGHYKCLLAYIDETGLGQQTAENLIKKWGSSVQAIAFTNASKQNLAQGIKSCLEDHKFRLPENDCEYLEIPDDVDVHSSLCSVKKEVTSSGLPKFDADATQATGHADFFWGAALAVHAAGTTEPFEPEFHAVGEPRFGAKVLDQLQGGRGLRGRGW